MPEPLPFTACSFSCCFQTLLIGAWKSVAWSAAASSAFDSVNGESSSPSSDSGSESGVLPDSVGNRFR